MQLIRLSSNNYYTDNHRIHGTHAAHGIHSLCPTGSVVTLGNFDGLHKGHQQLLHRVAQRAKEKQLSSILLTFEPLPRELFTPNDPPARLLKFREKWLLLQSSMLDYMAVLSFNHRLATMSAEQFVHQILVEQFRVKHVVIGADFRFGAKRLGDVALLQVLGQRYGFTVEALKQRTEQNTNTIISSTWLRELLQQGDFALANQLLGYQYHNIGKVIYGQQLGRTLGCPTANIALGRRKSVLHGVYCVQVTAIDDQQTALPAVASIGTRPAVNGKGFLLEVHLLTSQQDLYGKMLTITYGKKLRDEWMFDNLDALKQQIQRDCAAARSYFKLTN